MSQYIHTYCDGIGCLLRQQCRRYVEGQHVLAARHEGQYYWQDHCDPETREMYLTD